MKRNAQWTDVAGCDGAFEAANARLTASLTERPQQMQPQSEHCLAIRLFLGYA